MNKILEQEGVKNLIQTFDLEKPPLYKFVISDYEMVDDKIVINKIKVLDAEDKFLKFADLKKVFKYLKHTDTSFGRSENTEEDNKTP